MRNKLVVTAVLGGMVLVGSAAWAGRRATGGEVRIDLDDSEVQGGIAAARASADTVQSIGCTVGAVGTTTNVYCWGTNAAGVSRACVTTKPNFVAAAAALVEGSYLHFQYGEGGACISLSVLNSSQYSPKVP